MRTIEEIRPLVESKLARMGLELYDMKLVKAGAGSVLRIFIDKESGVTIGDCEAASNEISIMLDVENFSDTPYRLEVSSPGADRPLRNRRDFRRAMGRMVRVEITDEGGRQQAVTGKVTACSDCAITLETENGAREIPFSRLRYAKIEFSFK